MDARAATLAALRRLERRHGSAFTATVVDAVALHLAGADLPPGL